MLSKMVLRFRTGKQASPIKVSLYFYSKKQTKNISQFVYNNVSTKEWD